MVQVRDSALATKLEAAEVKFELDEILRRQHMERGWMELRIVWEHASVTGRSSPSSPYFKGCPPALRGKVRLHDLFMTMTYDEVMALPPVNHQLRAALREISPAGFSSEQLKRKWALQEEQLISNEAKRAKLVAAFKLREEKSELLDEDDGKLSDVKRLDKEIESMRLGGPNWRRNAKESYKWYYPYAELSSREERLTILAERLVEQAEARGTAAPTKSEVFGCMLLDLLATAAISPSVSAAFFPAV